MAQTHIISLLALRRLLQHAPSKAPLADTENTAETYLAENREGMQTALANAARHAWLALEIALAGSDVWELIKHSLHHSVGDIFRQQMDALLDLFSLAGLEIDNTDARRCCQDELRSARHGNLLARVSLDESAWDQEFHSREVVASLPDLQETEWQALWQAAGDLQQAGYPHLAGLVGLRSLWGEPLCLGAIHYFLCRALGGASPGWDLEKGRPDDCWRCLDVLAQLLAEREDALVALLDRSPDSRIVKTRDRGDTEAVERLRQLGLQRYLHGDYQQAAVHFTAALKLDPANALLYADRGDAYRLQCEYERAIADFHVALQLKPATPAFLVSRAIAYQLGGEFERAVADCSAALQLDPNNLPAYRTRAAAYVNLDARALALADLTEAIAQAPEDDAALYQRGVFHNEEREFPQAIADFNLVLRLNPHHILAYLQRGHAHLSQSDYVHAINDYGEVLLRHPNNVRAFSGRGRAFHLQGSTDRAITDYSEALRLEPNNAQVYCLRGMLYRAKGDFGLAMLDLEEAVRLDPENAAARYHRGKIFLAQGRFSQALIDLDETLHLQPKLLVGYLNRALVHFRLEHLSEAHADITQALKLNRNSPIAHLLLGIVHAHTEDYTAAIGDLSQAIVLDDRLTLAYQQRSLAFMLDNDHDRALEDCNQVIAREPRNAHMYVHRSMLYHNKGEIQLALLDYARALQIDPKCIMTGWHQGMAEIERDQFTQRIADYIEGRRPGAQIAELPPQIAFAIFVQPAGANGPTGTFPESSHSQAVPVPKEIHLALNCSTPADPANETGIPVATLQDETTSVSTTAEHSQTAEEATQASAMVVVPVEPGSDKAKQAAATPANQEKRRNPLKAQLKSGCAATTKPLKPQQRATPLKKKPDNVAQQSVKQDPDSICMTAPTDQAIDDAINELLTEPPEADETLQASQVACNNGAAGERAKLHKGKKGHSEPTEENPVECPNCRQKAIPVETLPGGRVRCGKCKSVFLPSAVTLLASAGESIVRPPTRKPVKKYDEDESRFMTKWGKPMPMAIGSIAALLAIYFFIPLQLFGKSDRVTVYPVLGQVELEGTPLPNATIFLHPVGEKDPQAPHPRGTAKDDGSFVLGTYGKDDGAPAGEYKVTVQCFKKLDPAEMENGRLPRNLLPARYGNVATTSLTVQIKEGENQIPVLRLKN